MEGVSEPRVVDLKYSEDINQYFDMKDVYIILDFYALYRLHK